MRNLTLLFYNLFMKTKVLLYGNTIFQIKEDKINNELVGWSIIRITCTRPSTHLDILDCYLGPNYLSSLFHIPLTIRYRYLKYTSKTKNLSSNKILKIIKKNNYNLNNTTYDIQFDQNKIYNYVSGTSKYFLNLDGHYDRSPLIKKEDLYKYPSLIDYTCDRIINCYWYLDGVKVFDRENGIVVFQNGNCYVDKKNYINTKTVITNKFITEYDLENRVFQHIVKKPIRKITRIVFE